MLHFLTNTQADGLCAIDISLARGFRWDSAKYGDLSEKAAALLSVCVWDRPRGPPVGGVLEGVGTNGRLTLTVRPYKPDVICYSNPQFADEGKCSKVVGTLPVSNDPFLFTRGGLPRGQKGVVIPEGGRKFTERT